MTGDELAIALHAEQGYLVLGSSHPLTVGAIERADKGAPMSTPLRIIDRATRAEWDKQGRLAFRLSGGLFRKKRNCPAEYFYRVVAVD